jgi:hypothetical protein
MGRKVWALALILASGFVPADALVACGDKFVSAARGTRFQQAPKGHSENILIYAHPASEVVGALAKVSAEATLRSAGYRPHTVTTESEFVAELRRGDWDLIIVGFADVEPVAQRLATQRRVLPVALRATKEQRRQALTKYRVVLTKAPNKEALVRLIAEALASRTNDRV